MASIQTKTKMSAFLINHIFPILPTESLLIRLAQLVVNISQSIKLHYHLGRINFKSKIAFMLLQIVLLNMEKNDQKIRTQEQLNKLTATKASLYSVSQEFVLLLEDAEVLLQKCPSLRRFNELIKKFMHDYREEQMIQEYYENQNETDRQNFHEFSRIQSFNV